jgi:hypothetical protein
VPPIHPSIHPSIGKTSVCVWKAAHLFYLLKLIVRQSSVVIVVADNRQAIFGQIIHPGRGFPQHNMCLICFFEVSLVQALRSFVPTSFHVNLAHLLCEPSCVMFPVLFCPYLSQASIAALLALMPSSPLQGIDGNATALYNTYSRQGTWPVLDRNVICQ